MSQHDLDLANAAGAAFRADLNNALQALGSLSSGAMAPSTTYAYMLWADTTSGQLKQRNAANSGWVVRATLAEAFTLSRSSNTILAEGDRSKTLIATGSYTQTLTAAATLGDGWAINIIVDSGVTLTVDPNGTETIDGATTKAIVGPAQGVLVCNGTLFRTIGFATAAASDTAAGVIEIAIQSEMEAGTDTARAVVPGRQHYHPSAAKAWVNCDNSGANTASYNVSSVTDVATGRAQANLTNSMSSANYAAISCTNGGGGGIFGGADALAAGSFELRSWNTSTQTLQDSGRNYGVVFGDM